MYYKKLFIRIINMPSVINSFFIITLICVIWYWYMIYDQPHMLHRPFDNLFFKTGDLILFHAYDNINPVFIGSYWGHVGVVFKNPDDANANPMLFEAARTSQMKNCPDSNKSGIIISDLKTRLEKYKGIVSLKSLNIPVQSEIIRGFTKFMTYAKSNMYYNESVISNAIGKKMGNRFTNATNCGEIALLSLVKLAILPQTILQKNIAHHLLYVAQLKQTQNNYYNKPIEITFNPF
jgi:hypothetical protein